MGRNTCAKIKPWCHYSTYVPLVLLDVVQVIAADDNGALHLDGDDQALQDTAADGHVTGKGALLVNVSAVQGGSGGLEAKANILGPTGQVGLLALLHHAALADKHGVLLLESLLGLQPTGSPD